eukprot:63196_1
MANSSWSIIVAIVYFSLYFLLVVGLAIHIHIKKEHDSKKSFVSALWKKRGIYGQIFIHVYDTATDIAVMVEWYLLAEQERNAQTPEDNVESLDMNALFWTTVAFLIIYRVISICLGCGSAVADGESWWIILIDGCCLGLLDLYIIKTVYQSIKDEDTEASPRQKMIQLTESIFESLPQVVLQSVFVIRSWNDDDVDGLRYDNSIELVAMSLVASLFSISNKYCWVDRDAVVEECRDAHLSTKCPCVNPLYVLRIIWRFSYITTRFCILSLVWSVMGGAFCLMFLALSWLLWTVINVVEWSEGCKLITPDCDSCLAVFLAGMYGIVSLIASPASPSLIHFVSHALEMSVTLGLITLFAFVSSIECDICADPSHRSSDNKYVLGFIIAGWSAMVIDLGTFSIMRCLGMFEDDDEAVLAIGFMFAQGVQNKEEI